MRRGSFAHQERNRAGGKACQVHHTPGVNPDSMPEMRHPTEGLLWVGTAGAPSRTNGRFRRYLAIGIRRGQGQNARQSRCSLTAGLDR